MLLKTLVETPDGEVEVTANLKPQEVKFLLEYAINSLMQRGVLPFTFIDKGEEATVMELSGETH